MYRPSQLVRFSFAQKFRSAVCIFYLTLGMLCAAGSIFGRVDGGPPETGEPVEATNAVATYDWNLKQTQRPMLNLPDQLDGAFDLSLASPSSAYAMGRLKFPLFQEIEFDARAHKYLLLSEKTGRRGQAVEFREAGTPGTYLSTDKSYVSLLDYKGVKTIRASDNTEYTFIRFNDGAFKCIRIKTAEGAIITIVYSKDNLIHSIVDSAGRTIQFNYADRRVGSITQTWTANSGPVSRTWPVGSDHSHVKLAHAGRAPIAYAALAPLASTNIARPVKRMPNNAITPEYTAAMASSDKQLAEIFGGPAAVAAANGFEPDGLAEQYPLYRGDLTGFDGRLLRGHLSYAMHLYGNSEGTGDSALYVPAGFTSHSSEPGPTDAAVTFFYPRLGNLTNVTLAVFHVANFDIKCGTGLSPMRHAPENGRIRIGNIGGPGGSYFAYKHSHIEFYRGDVGLPSASAREHLRIDPASVFALRSLAANRM